MTNHQKILNLLSDNRWHCGLELNALYLKDDRKRISELIKKGYNIISAKCDLPGHIHYSGLLKRKLVNEEKIKENFSAPLRPRDTAVSEAQRGQMILL